MSGPIEASALLANRLREAGFPLNGLTKSSTEKFKILRKEFPFLESFEWIMISGEFGLTKPDARVFEVFLERSGLNKTDYLYIDGSDATGTVALSTGWRSIVFRSPDPLAAELEIRGIRTGRSSLKHPKPGGIS